MKSWTLQEFDFVFYLATDIKEIKNEKVAYKFWKDLNKDPKPGALCHMDDDKEGAYILILPEQTETFIDLVDYVSHEVYHAVGFLYESIEDETEIQDVAEVPAYIQGWLTGKVLEALGYE